MPAAPASSAWTARCTKRSPCGLCRDVPGAFSLREAPFAITPDSSFYYPHEGAQAALNTLLVALRSGEGFLKIVGEVGCGKTVLCRQLLKTLQGEFVTAYVPNPDMGPDDLLMALCMELCIPLTPPISRHWS